MSPIPPSLEKALGRLTANLQPASSVSSKFSCSLTTATCPNCKDHPGVFLENDGVYIRAKLCECVIQCKVCAGTCSKPEGNAVSDCKSPTPLKIVGIVNDAKIPGRYIDSSLKNFSNHTGSGKSVISQISRWIDHFIPGKSSGILLTGTVGVGKTYILSAIAKEMALRGFSVRFADFFQLVNELRENYSSDQKNVPSEKPLSEFDVLIIDELGKGRNSEWEVSIADGLISDRYNGNKCIIASTNYGLKDTGNDTASRNIDIWSTNSPTSANQMNTDSFETLHRRLGPRIYSRLKEMTVFLELTGADFRRH